MKEISKQPESLPTANIWILFVLALGVLVLFSFLFDVSGTYSSSRISNIIVPPQGFLRPMVYAAGQTVKNGLEMFSGKTLEQVPQSLRAVALLALLIVYVVCPTIFFLKWRNKKIRENAHSGSSWLYRLDAFYFVSLLAVFVIGLSAVVDGPLGYYHRTDLYKAQAIQTHRDEITHEIAAIGVKVAEYRILPKELGGGAGSLDGFVLPTEWLATENAYYVATVQDTVVNLQAISALYNGGLISVTIGKNGKIQSWQHSMLFNP